jgi:hypothetical protein
MFEGIDHHFGVLREADTVGDVSLESTISSKDTHIDGSMYLGCSSPAKPALMMPEPFSKLLILSHRFTEASERTLSMTMG